MIFSRSLLAALCSATLALAADNAFIIPDGGLSATAGQPLQLSWTPSTSGTVSLVLRSGASSDLAEGTVIASNIANSGNYTWNVPTMIERGSDYTVEIVDDSNPSDNNFTPYFVLESDITTALSTSQVTLGAPSSSIATSTASATGAATAVTTSGASSSAASSTGSHSSGATSSASKSSSGSSSGSSTMATSTSGSATHASTSATASVATSTGTSGADKLSAAAAGLFGVGAIAAFVL